MRWFARYSGPLVTGALLLASVSHATDPLPVINYQGQFTDDAGVALVGPVDLTFTFYAVATAGDALWSEIHPAVELTDGSAAVLLGTITPLPDTLFASGERYLEITVDADVLTPRLRVGTVPFAFSAESVHWDNVLGVPDGFADGVDNTGDAPGPFTGADIVDGSLTASDMALETLTGANIIDDGISSADILDNTITGADIKEKSIAANDIADETITSDKVADGALQVQDMGFLVGDITSVTVSGGLSGGSTSGDVVLSVGAGPGIQVSGSTVSLQPAYLSGSAYTGVFVGQTIPSWQPQTGNVSVAGAVFHPATPVGKYTVRATSGYLFVDDVNNVGAEDEFTAPIQLPHGAEIIELRVSYWDNSAGTLEVALYRARKSNGQTAKLASVTSLGETASWQIISDPTIAETGVDNSEFVYWLVADFPSTPQGENLRLLAAQIKYTVTRPY